MATAGESGIPRFSAADLPAMPPQQPPAHTVNKMVRGLVPEWADRALGIAETDWEIRLDSFHPLALLMLRAQGYWTSRPLQPRLAKAVEAFDAMDAYAGWTVELRGDYVVGDGLTVKRVDESGRPAVWADRRDLVVEQRVPPMLEGVLFMTDPTGASFALVALERAFIDDTRVITHFFDVHPVGDADASLHFHEEFARVTNRLREQLREHLPNDAVDVINTALMLDLDDSLEWDDLCLPEPVMKGVREDFEFFLAHEEWYRRNRLPYKRSYLLAGPPGNGKTSIVRVMARTPGFRAITFDFAAEDNRNEDLQRAFSLAVERAPCLFILEDVDRLFGEHAVTRVTKEAILNCLDGVSSNNGVIIAATANHPELLDGAVRHRPGRFDRVVYLENPDEPLRFAFLQKLFSRSPDSEVTEETIRLLAAETDGFSMAHLKELFIGAGRETFNGQALKIQDDHTRRALAQLRLQFSETLGRRVGFGGH